MGETLVEEGQVLESTTVQIYRTATVVKGGRRFSFGALVVVGDRQGSVGIGYGKAPGVPAAIEKAQKTARKTLAKATLLEGTLPHEITSKFGASKVKLVPAAPGTGVIAGATVRTVLELAGVRDCLTKSFGSNNQKNLLKAAYQGLMSLRSKSQIAELRAMTLDDTDVEKRLEAGRRFAPSAPAQSAAPPLRAPKGPGRGRGGKPNPARPSPAAAPIAAAPPASDQAPAEPVKPAEPAAAEPAATEAPPPQPPSSVAETSPESTDPPSAGQPPQE